MPALLLHSTFKRTLANTPATHHTHPGAIHLRKRLPSTPFLTSTPYLPLMSSGPMYSGVPIRIVSMLLLAAQALAKPKSHSFRRGGLRWSRMVLSSFRSLWEVGEGCGVVW